MTNSQAFASELENAYDRLHPTIRRWIHDQGWEELREIQARAVFAVLDGAQDLVIAAATAAGKTEAAFLPILTSVADRTASGLSVVYISPLKALINDQFRRLDELCEQMEIPVVRWHGDAPQAAKRKTLENPRGVALITPESIEAMMCRHAGQAVRMLCSADFIVIDEVHAFLHGPRGLQLASLLRRIDALSERRARRVGLSATIGDFALAKSWLRPANPELVDVLKAKSEQPELKLQVRGYVEPPGTNDPDTAETSSESDCPIKRVALDDIADHLFKKLRGTNNLVFGCSRRTVEATADRLLRRCVTANVPNEFFPHHGSLSKVLREELEERLKAGNLPTTAIATSTLELGIDIGSVTSVAQIGAPRSLSSLRQRLGRTGRRRQVPAILRVYVREPCIDRKTRLIDKLHPATVRAIAAIRLLLAGFVEPPGPASEVASTLIHQTLSVIGQRCGAHADTLYKLLCGPGPFELFARRDYAELLLAIGSPQASLIEQAPDGTLMLGPRGEQIFQSQNFYAVFETPTEWRLSCGGRILGMLPISNPVFKDGLVVFAGRRWIVQDTDERTKTLIVTPHSGGVVPKFERTGFEPVHDRLSQEMLAVYKDRDVPACLDHQAREALAEAREVFEMERLDTYAVLQDERDLHVFTWRGSQMNSVFGAVLAKSGRKPEPHDFGLTLAKTSADEFDTLLTRIAEMKVEPLEVASFVRNIHSGKFAEFVPRPLAERLWVRQNAELLVRVPSLASALGGSLAR
jgi:ATP-dependent Lhr-like helicase